ncbi:MAG: hypothetical protein V1874_07730 [Spirochaetota bacterium]
MKKFIPIIIILFFASLCFCSNNTNDSEIQQTPKCQPYFYSSETYINLNGPSETGSVSFAQECEYLYIGGFANPPNAYLYKINISTHELIYKAIPQKAYRMVLVGDYLWTAGGSTGAAGIGSFYLQKINKNSLESEWEDHSTFDDVRALAYDGKYIWAADRGTTKRLHRINPETNEIYSYEGIILDGARHMCFDGTYLWVTCSSSGSIVRIKPEDRSFTVINGLSNVWAICFDGINIIAACMTGNIYKIDTATAAVIQSSTLTDCLWLCHADYDGKYIWITDNSNANVKIVNPLDLSLIDTIDTLAMPHKSHYDGKYQWILHEDNVRLFKLSK